MRLSIQLYTVRDLIKDDFSGTVQQLAKIGYRAVEMGGYGNLKSAKEARKALDDAGLECSGSHATIDVLQSDINKIMDEHDTLGSKNIICPWLPEERRKDADGWKRAAADLTKI